MAKTLKKPLSVLLAVLMFVGALTPVAVFADDNFETLDFTNDHTGWGPSGFTQFHFTITPYGADDLYADGYWEFDPDYTGCYTVITGEYGETITKLVVHYDEDCLPPEVIVNGEKVDGSAENGEMTYEGLSASSVRVGAVEEYEDWNTVIIFSIDVYYTGGDAPDPSDAAIELINAIGTVEYTDACKAKIDAAREAYNKLDDADKAKVTNYDVLVAAEAAYQDFVDHDRANRVITVIDNLGAVENTAAYKIKLMNARNAYNGLTDTQKALVTNYDVLTTAEEDFAANSTIVNAGQFGGLYWMLDRDGVMTFSGKGEIPMTAFWHNTWIRKVIFNSSVTHIRSSSFSDSKNLTEVVFEAPVGVDNVIFMNSHNLGKVTLPDGFGRIGPYMFEGCTALDSIDIPASVNSIDKEVFAGTSIKTLVFRHGVAHTADSFNGMGQLETLVIANDSAINYTSAVFSGLQAVTNVYVPAGSTYKPAETTKYQLFVKDEYEDNYDENDFNSARELFEESVYVYENDPDFAMEEIADNGYDRDKYEYREVTVPGVDAALTDGVSVPECFGAATVYTYEVPTEAIDLFKSVGTIENDDECKAKIAEAKTAYESLTDIQKMAVKYYYKTVTDKETDINNREAAAAVTNQIGALPTTDVTLEDKDTVEAARAAYDALTDEAKALIDPSVLNALVAAETAIAELEAEAAANQQAADSVVALINALPETLTSDDKEAVEAARAAYEARTDEQKALIDPAVLAALEAAEEAVADQSAKVSDQIGALPEEISLDDKAAIEAARAAYEALSDEDKEKVDPAVLAKLVAAETAIANLEAAAEVADVIDALPEEVALEDRTAIAAARAAYEALTDEQKALVDPSALAALEAAEGALDEIIDAIPTVEADGFAITINDYRGELKDAYIISGHFDRYRAIKNAAAKADYYYSLSSSKLAAKGGTFTVVVPKDGEYTVLVRRFADGVEDYAYFNIVIKGTVNVTVNGTIVSAVFDGMEAKSFRFAPGAGLDTFA